MNKRPSITPETGIGWIKQPERRDTATPVRSESKETGQERALREARLTVAETITDLDSMIRKQKEHLSDLQKDGSHQERIMQAEDLLEAYQRRFTILEQALIALSNGLPLPQGLEATIKSQAHDMTDPNMKKKLESLYSLIVHETLKTVPEKKKAA